MSVGLSTNDVFEENETQFNQENVKIKVVYFSSARRQIVVSQSQVLQSGGMTSSLRTVPLDTESQRAEESYLTVFPVNSPYNCSANATSFPGSLILPPPGARERGGGRMRDPGNEVGENDSNRCA